MTMSASLTASASMVAPTATYSESGIPDLSPAPGSMATLTPSALNFFTVSGEIATRGSDASISLATAIFMGPPAAHGARASRRTERQRRPRAAETMSGQENAHQGDDGDDADGAPLHE